jgi:Ca-activated chloride channel family protein
MKSKLFILSIAVVIVLCGFRALAQQPESTDKTLSPYFQVQGGESDVEQFALESTSADIKVAGVIADVVVTQVYKNDGKKPIEAIYIFPASTRAAVYGLKMTIGERVIVAKIEERQKARQQYEEARDAGQSASLLEQQRPNVFQMNVANIMPGDHIKVELRYTELLIPREGVYELAYPTVVGPRYSNQPEAAAPASEHWVQNPYLHEGEAAPYGFDLKVEIAAGLPISDVTCKSHQVDVSYEGKNIARVSLKPGEPNGGNRDFILDYRLAGDRIQTGLLLFQGERENFFLLMAQPPKRVNPQLIPPREFVFIVDVSGSMNGFPLEISKKVLKDLIGRLRPEDKFNVLLFAASSSALSEKGSLPATPENIQKALAVIDEQQGGGGTELLPALQHALALSRDEGVSRTVVILTDGYVTVEKEAFDLIRSKLGDANMFAFGIGSSVNRFLIEGIARAGMGEPFVVESPDRAEAEASRFRQYIQTPVLTNVRVSYKNFTAYDIEPPSVPDVLAERPVIVFGKWRGQPGGDIVITGRSGEGEYRQVIPVGSTKPMAENAALRYLWARHRIAVLDDYNQLAPSDERVKEVTNLGLTYNLLTAYTSFVAIDSQVRNKDGRPVTVKQPLPLPQGVSNLAVGGAAGTYKMARGMGMPASAPAPRYDASVSGPGLADGLGAVEEEHKEKDGTIASGAAIETLTVSGGLAEDAVRKVVEAELEKIARCLTAGSNLSGRMTFTFVIGADGRVRDLKLASSELGYGRLEQCAKEKIKNWSFPTGKETTVTVTFTLAP